VRILVFQHVSVEHPGVFREFWTQAGHTYDTVEIDAGDPIPDLAPYDFMVVMGGPMDVWQVDIHPWLLAEKAAIQTWVEQMQRPYFGICLGHQLLADALGGEVSLMPAPEVGLVDVELTEAGRVDPMFDGFDTTTETFQWHGAEVSALPRGAAVLASNEACRIQAMRWGRWAYGFQYHCEIIASTVGDWQCIPEYATSLDRSLGPERAALLGSDVKTRLPLFREAAERLNRNLCAIIEQQGLPSKSVSPASAHAPF
jgi:GMP synthase-like glutamine amidotransferase